MLFIFENCIRRRGVVFSVSVQEDNMTSNEFTAPISVLVSPTIEWMIPVVGKYNPNLPTIGADEPHDHNICPVGVLSPSITR
jgi:hypothetical protein